MEIFYYRRLEVYKNSKLLILDIHRLLKDFPSEEKYALCDQVHRASISITSNIAEAFGRYSDKERIHFLEISNGSLMEVSSQIEIAHDLNYISDDTLENIDNQVLTIAKQLAKLRNKIINNNPQTPNT